jgi:hypothetical protein
LVPNHVAGRFAAAKVAAAGNGDIGRIGMDRQRPTY